MASAIYLIGVGTPIYVEQDAQEVNRFLNHARDNNLATVEFDIRNSPNRKTYVSPNGVSNIRDLAPKE